MDETGDFMPFSGNPTQPNTEPTPVDGVADTESLIDKFTRIMGGAA